ncbi:ABC transporter ATP-binding protein [Sinanaerobacter sp. ZZT-01]|uniref:ABC transporter ATP-binding protein n=1 Tax=Sinanaerobacter sp. ZZT-01 TaxID=3111540 RepID=UPI002D779D88|nr:ABC transporter ATP-binding protein [Sinanaerobacter sp. ZZT-01]WRR93316.1 ABC transporter ATP-binding protein [Sinanaerobacter sp. ZZT-01]
MCLISINHLSFSYPVCGQAHFALDDIDFQINDGEFICLIGHSGSGKSTFLKLLAGILSPDDGEIYIEGRKISAPGTDRAVVFQNHSLFPWLTVIKNVIFTIQVTNKKMTKRQAEHTAKEYLTKVGMIDFQDKYPDQLSGGMYQRAAIARALAMESNILLLDEPFGALDAKIRKKLQQLLEYLWGNGEKRKTVLFVTHDIDEAILLADRIVFMHKGRIIADKRVTFPRPRNQNEAAYSEHIAQFKSDLLDLFYLEQETLDEEGI